jgi:hypothetical protein
MPFGTERYFGIYTEMIENSKEKEGIPKGKGF